GNAEGVEEIVTLTVHANGVAAGVNGAHDGGTPSHLLAQDEKRGAVARRSERREHAWRRHRVRSVVEGECDAGSSGGPAGHDSPVHLEPRQEHTRRGDHAPAERTDRGETRLPPRHGFYRGRRAPARRAPPDRAEPRPPGRHGFDRERAEPGRRGKEGEAGRARHEYCR